MRPGASESAQGHEAPDSLDDAEEPGPREETVGARQSAAEGESCYETRAATLERIHQHHEAESDNAKYGESQLVDQLEWGGGAAVRAPRIAARRANRASRRRRASLIRRFSASDSAIRRGTGLGLRVTGSNETNTR